MIIKRCQLRSGGVDTTVKSAMGAIRELAPTWSMVMGHKQGTVSDKEYTSEYLLILHKAYQGWQSLRNDSNGTLLWVACYCPDGKFCHTYLIGLYASLRWPKLFEDRTGGRQVLGPEIISQVEEFVKLNY